MAERTDVDDITVERDRQMTIVFADGHRCTYPIEELRAWCPCATCRNYRDRGEDAWPRPDSPRPLAVTDAELVGAWGVALTWNDGHRTGIYPWVSLREWCEAGGPVFPADSGL